jgi:hypothetical protein
MIRSVQENLYVAVYWIVPRNAFAKLIVEQALQRISGFVPTLLMKEGMCISSLFSVPLFLVPV